LSKFIRHDNCPKCGSKDNLSVYDDHEYCFSFDCDHIKFYNDGGRSIEKERGAGKPSIITPLPSKTQPASKARALDGSTINKYKVTINTDKDSNVEAVFPRFNEEGMHISNQVRFKDKGFKCEGEINTAALFGQTFFPAGGRSITITEGYYDTLAAFQLTGSRYPNVGVMSASTAKKEIVNNFEYLNSFEKIVLNFDNDEPGQAAATAVAEGALTPAGFNALMEAVDADGSFVMSAFSAY